MSTSKRSIPGRWQEAGSLSVANGELGVTGRDVATVDALAAANTIKIVPPTPGPYGMLIRFRSDGDVRTGGVAQTEDKLHMYAARGGNDFYRRIAILDTDVGTSDTAISTIHFIDTIDPSEEDGHHDAEEQNLTINRTATYYLRVFGCDRFIIVAATLNSDNLYCDVCWLWE